MTTPDDDRPTTWAGNAPLDSRWWWSSVLPIGAGAAVIAFQVSAYTGEGGTWLNAVMIAVGAAVAAYGLAGLRKAYRDHRAAEAGPGGPGAPGGSGASGTGPGAAGTGEPGTGRTSTDG